MLLQRISNSHKGSIGAIDGRQQLAKVLRWLWVFFQVLDDDMCRIVAIA